MPNQHSVSPLPDLPDLTPEELAYCFRLWLKVDERTDAWFAKKVGVRDTRTLRSWLEDRPDRLPVGAWLAGLAALGRNLDDVRATVAELRAAAPTEAVA